MRFSAHERLLKLLVGSNLYGEPAVCVRELVQNAWDATEWRRTQGDGAAGRIIVAFSEANNWFEVRDTGIGMDSDAIENSFLQVGQNKLEALGQTDIGEQVAYFGIGVLSVFLVAESVEVSSYKLGAAEGLRFRIVDLETDFDLETGDREEFGTTVRVYVRDDANFRADQVAKALSDYVRHVPNVSLEDSDRGTTSVLEEIWDIDNLESLRPVTDSKKIRSGKLGFQPALQRQEGTLGNRITLCNAGFLVERNTLDLLPLNNLGLAGELDIHPGVLNIVMSRERFQRDESWSALGNDLLDWFSARALEEVSNGFLKETGKLDTPEVKRCLIIWAHFLPDHPALSALRSEVHRRLFETVPFAVAERTPSSIKQIISQPPNSQRIYFRNIHASKERSQSVDDEGVPIRFTEEIRDSIRVGALRANGFAVIEASQIPVTFQEANRASSIAIQESQLIVSCLSGREVEVIDIAQARESDMDFTSVEYLPMLRSLFALAGDLRFASVPESGRRVVTDAAGVRYLNIANRSVQRLLKVVSAAISNPLKRKLLAAYLGAEEYRMGEVRQILIELLERNDLDAMARTETAVLTSEAVAAAVSRVLKDDDT